MRDNYGGAAEDYRCDGGAQQETEGANNRLNVVTTERRHIPKPSGKPDPTAHLSAADVEALARELDALRQEVLGSRGTADTSQAGGKRSLPNDFSIRNTGKRVLRRRPRARRCSGTEAVLGESLPHTFPKVKRGAAREAVNVALWLRRGNGWIPIAGLLLIPIFVLDRQD